MLRPRKHHVTRPWSCLETISISRDHAHATRPSLNQRPCSCHEIILMLRNLAYAMRPCSYHEIMLMPRDHAHVTRSCPCNETILISRDHADAKRQCSCHDVSQSQRCATFRAVNRVTKYCIVCNIKSLWPLQDQFRYICC